MSDRTVTYAHEHHFNANEGWVLDESASFQGFHQHLTTDGHLFPWHIHLLLTGAQIFDRKFLYLMLDSMFIRAKCFNETYIFCKAALKIYVL